jgi:hypothetical protein
LYSALQQALWQLVLMPWLTRGVPAAVAANAQMSHELWWGVGWQDSGDIHIKGSIVFGDGTPNGNRRRHDSHDT